MRSTVGPILVAGLCAPLSRWRGVIRRRRTRTGRRGAPPAPSPKPDCSSRCRVGMPRVSIFHSRCWTRRTFVRRSPLQGRCARAGRPPVAGSRLDPLGWVRSQRSGNECNDPVRARALPSGSSRGHYRRPARHLSANRAIMEHYMQSDEDFDNRVNSVLARLPEHPAPVDPVQSQPVSANPNGSHRRSRNARHTGKSMHPCTVIRAPEYLQASTSKSRGER